jgi:hypothetical protein
MRSGFYNQKPSLPRCCSDLAVALISAVGSGLQSVVDCLRHDLPLVQVMSSPASARWPLDEQVHQTVAQSVVPTGLDFEVPGESGSDGPSQNSRRLN